MVEYSEDDLARELEEMKLQEQGASAAAAGNANANTAAADDGEMPVSLPAGPKRRAPPRRKTGSCHLANLDAGTGEGEG